MAGTGHKNWIFVLRMSSCQPTERTCTLLSASALSHSSLSLRRSCNLDGFDETMKIKMVMKVILALSVTLIANAFHVSIECSSGFNEVSVLSSGRSALFAQPRRTLPKRERKKKRINRNEIQSTPVASTNEDFWEGSELRPIISSKSVLAGEDYWIDEKDLRESQEREKAVKNRKAMEGEISQEKLKDEIVAPYKQNWIGIISVSIVVLAFLGTQFPDIFQPVMIPNVPDTL